MIDVINMIMKKCSSPYSYANFIKEWLLFCAIKKQAAGNVPNSLLFIKNDYPFMYLFLSILRNF